jgi:hypothetical protein
MSKKGDYIKGRNKGFFFLINEINQEFDFEKPFNFGHFEYGVWKLVASISKANSFRN